MFHASNAGYLPSFWVKLRLLSAPAINTRMVHDWPVRSKSNCKCDCGKCPRSGWVLHNNGCFEMTTIPAVSQTYLCCLPALLLCDVLHVLIASCVSPLRCACCMYRQHVHLLGLHQEVMLTSDSAPTCCKNLGLRFTCVLQIEQRFHLQLLDAMGILKLA